MLNYYEGIIPIDEYVTDYKMESEQIFVTTADGRLHEYPNTEENESMILEQINCQIMKILSTYSAQDSKKKYKDIASKNNERFCRLGLCGIVFAIIGSVFFPLVRLVLIISPGAMLATILFEPEKEKNLLQKNVEIEKLEFWMEHKDEINSYLRSQIEQYIDLQFNHLPLEQLQQAKEQITQLISLTLKDIIDNRFTIEQMQTLLEYKNAEFNLPMTTNDNLSMNTEKQKTLGTIPQK